MAAYLLCLSASRSLLQEIPPSVSLVFHTRLCSIPSFCLSFSLSFSLLLVPLRVFFLSGLSHSQLPLLLSGSLRLLSSFSFSLVLPLLPAYPIASLSTLPSAVLFISLSLTV